ncbi:MAG: DUF4292 domain-containing protein [Deltaproteobacteria bacterium]|nr:DUF4292 domain-containing protein [Deltaproteobacteria bacterium]
MRFYSFQGVALLFALALAAGCAEDAAYIPPQVSENPLSPQSPAFVEARPFPFQASGGIRWVYRGKREGLRMSLGMDSKNQGMIRMETPVVGTTAAEMWFSPEKLILLDYRERAFFKGPNTPAQRGAVLGADLSPMEFRMALTGRVPQGVFRQGKGWVTPTAKGAEAGFQAGSAEYRFTLGPKGWPTKWEKWEGGQLRFRVEYGYWERVPWAGPSKGGGVLMVPLRIKVLDWREKSGLSFLLDRYHPGEVPPRFPSKIPPEKGWVAMGIAPVREEKPVASNQPTDSSLEPTREPTREPSGKDEKSLEKTLENTEKIKGKANGKARGKTVKSSQKPAQEAEQKPVAAQQPEPAMPSVPPTQPPTLETPGPATAPVSPVPPAAAPPRFLTPQEEDYLEEI